MRVGLKREIYALYERVHTQKSRKFEKEDESISWRTGAGNEQEPSERPSGAEWSRDSILNLPSESLHPLRKFSAETRERCKRLQRQQPSLKNTWHGGVLRWRFNEPMPVCWPFPKSSYCSNDAKDKTSFKSISAEAHEWSCPSSFAWLFPDHGIVLRAFFKCGTQMATQIVNGLTKNFF